MKYIILITLFMTFLNANTPQVKKINELLKKIEININSSTKDDIDITYDPFFPHEKIVNHVKKIKYKKHYKRYSAKPSLSMILNDEAFINGKWYRENQKVEHFMLKEIHDDYVVLSRGKTKLRISINNPHDRLLTKEEH